jgi:hypothetical protein
VFSVASMEPVCCGMLLRFSRAAGESMATVGQWNEVGGERQIDRVENNAFNGENSGVTESVAAEELAGTVPTGTDILATADSVNNAELESFEDTFLLNSTYVPLGGSELSLNDVLSNEGALENS